MSYEVDRTGIEIELQAVSNKDGLSKSDVSVEGTLVPKIRRAVDDSLFHFDDGKVEFSSKAMKTLGDMEEHLRTQMVPALEVMREYCLPITIGCPASYIDFASGHIHKSVKGMNSRTWIDLRQKLSSLQPMLALLSQNSPVVNGVRAADVRLLLGNWSIFTDFDNINDTHYMAIAYGNNGATIEVRIPSAGPIWQLLAISNLISVVLEEDVDAIPVPHVIENWNNVIKYGSSSLCKVAIPKSLRFDGLKTKSMILKSTDLFKVFYEDNYEMFEKGLSTMSAKGASQVRSFYEFICNGHTLSDSIYELIINMVKSNNERDLALKLSDFSINSYEGKNPWDDFSKNPKPYMPVIDKFYSIDELRELLVNLPKSTMLSKIQDLNKEDLLLFLGKNGMMYNGNFRNFIYNLSRGKLYKASDVHLPKTLMLNLFKNKVIVLNEELDCIYPSDNFAYIAALAKEGGFV